MGLIIPLAYYGLIPFVLLTGMGIGQLIAERSLAGYGWLVPIWFVLGISLYLSGRYAQWMVAQADFVRRQPDAEDDDAPPNAMDHATDS
jgi:hypothetical protein